jgi:hypothetical protein
LIDARINAFACSKKFDGGGHLFWGPLRIQIGSTREVLRPRSSVAIS